MRRPASPTRKSIRSRPRTPSSISAAIDSTWSAATACKPAAGVTPALNSTFNTLSAIDLPGLVAWTQGGAGTAKASIRQITDPSLAVTGGDIFEIAGRTHLVFGQNFQGNYGPGSNGMYTDQVRSFDIVDDGINLSLANPTQTPDVAAYRRRDLNIVPVIKPGPGGQLNQGLVALSGVFTPSNGAWTVPVEIDANGNPTMADPNDPATFKQGMNGYHSAKVGLFSESTGQMHEILFGGISYQYYDSRYAAIPDRPQSAFRQRHHRPLDRRNRPLRREPHRRIPSHQRRQRQPPAASAPMPSSFPSPVSTPIRTTC